MAIPRHGEGNRQGWRRRNLSANELAEIERCMRAGVGIEPITKRFKIGKDRAAEMRDGFGLAPVRSGPKVGPRLETAARLYAAGEASSTELAKRFGLKWPQSVRGKARDLGLLVKEGINPRSYRRLVAANPSATKVADVDAVAHWREEAKLIEAKERLRKRMDPYGGSIELLRAALQRANAA